MERGSEVNDESTYSRRSLLKTGEAAAAGTVLGTVATGTVSARDSCALSNDSDYYSEISYEAKKETTDYSESTYRKSYYSIVTRAIELRSSAMVADSWYDTYHDQYKCHLLLAGHLQTQEKDGDWTHYPNIQKQKVIVENKRPSTTAMLTSEDADWIGGVPAPGDELNYGEAAFTVLKAAIGSVDPKLGMAITAYDATNQLLADGESSSKNDEIEEYKWGYGTFDQPCESAHFIKIELQADTGEKKMEADMTSEGYHDNPDQSVSKGWNLYVYEDYYEDISGASGAWMKPDDRPEPGTEGYQEYLENSPNFVKVPYEDLQDKSKTEPGHAIYRSKNPKVEITRI